MLMDMTVKVNEAVPGHGMNLQSEYVRDDIGVSVLVKIQTPYTLT